MLKAETTPEFATEMDYLQNYQSDFGKDFKYKFVLSSGDELVI